MTTRLLCVDVDAIRNELDELRDAAIQATVADAVAIAESALRRDPSVKVNLTAIEAAAAVEWSDKYPALDLLRDEIPQ